MHIMTHIDIIDWMLKGIMIGILASAPMGPVGILCIQRTLNKGRWFGLVTGIGAAISDIIYAMITGFGMSFVVDFIQDPRYSVYLKISGSVLLFLFGIFTFRSDPTKMMHKSSNKRGTLYSNAATGFLVTLSNPFIIFLFMACFAQFDPFIAPERPFEMGIGFVSIIAGAMLWWFGLTWLINKIRAIFDVEGIRVINRIIGTIVIICSLVFFIGTAFNLYTLDSLYVHQ